MSIPRPFRQDRPGNPGTVSGPFRLARYRPSRGFPRFPATRRSAGKPPRRIHPGQICVRLATGLR